MREDHEHILTLIKYHKYEEILSLKGEEYDSLIEHAAEIKKASIGNTVYLRGLIEYSNVCGKNCYYCGIRRGNKSIPRYTLSEEEVLSAAKFAYYQKFGSVVIQAGEIESKEFTRKIESLIQKIMELSHGELGITLSLGEQEPEVYKRWLDAGAQRYLLRIEASNPNLFKSIHPDNSKHNFSRRLDCLKSLKSIGYQTGTGVMIGFPGQTLADLASDIKLFRNLDIDMIGMGPYIDHSQTPMHDSHDLLLSSKDRLELALKMIALCRIEMPKVNIASATALQSLDQDGRELGVYAGANVIMPNVTPAIARSQYNLYENKVSIDVINGNYLSDLEYKLKKLNHKIGWGTHGNSKHFYDRISGFC